MNFFKNILFTEKDLDVKIDDIIGEDEIIGVKPTKQQESSSFLEGFDIKNYTYIDKKIQHGVKNPTKVEVPIQKTDDTFTQSELREIDKKREILEKREILKNSLLIMINTNITSPELDFIGTSRINGKPIYRYIGKDFQSFREKYWNYEFEEVFYNPGIGIR